MKKIIFTLTNLLIFTIVFAQTPAQFKYQAVLRDAGGNILANQSKTVVIDILQGTATGTSVFTESHSVTTTAQGLINLNIGSIEDLSGIDWKADEYFIQITVDGTIMGTSQLLSVPYALQSKEVENVNYSQISGTPDLSGYLTDETDPVFSNWDKTEGISITESQISDLGNYIETETQNLNDVLTGNNSAGNKNIADLANPVNAQDAATKAYVDLLEERLNELEGIIYGVTDIDGNFYKGVKIGNQIWLAENLKTTKYSDGTPIPNVTENTTWAGLTTPAYCWYENDYTTNGKVYGALYNWYAVDAGSNNNKNICPTGWHVPSNDEWLELQNYLIANGYNYDGTTTGNKIAKAMATDNGWTFHSIEGSVGNTDYQEYRNKSKFSALPAGWRSASNGVFNAKTANVSWWTSTSNNTYTAWYKNIDNYAVDLYSYGGSYKQNGCSVRCIKD